MCSHNDQCAPCAYAQWETGDSEFTHESWVEECDCPHITETILSEVFENNRSCPFFVPKHENIWFFRNKIHTCPKCNSPRIKVTDYFLEEQNNGFPFVASGICSHCNHKFTIISKDAYLLGDYNPIDYQKILNCLPIRQLD